MRRYSILLAQLALLVAVTVPAQEPGAGLPGGFLRFGASARSLAMGSAATGLADDAASLYYNPAGMEQVRGSELLFFHAELMADVRYDFIGYVQPLGNLGTIGFAGMLLGSDGYERATAYEDLDETFKDSQSSLQVSFARRFGLVNLAATYRNVNQNLAEYSASGSGLDMSFYTRPHRTFSFGLNLQNLVAPTLTLVETPESYPLTIRAGGALHLARGRVRSVVDMLYVDSAPVGLYTGLELWTFSSLAMRGGWDTMRSSYTAGTGYRRGSWQLDYAVADSPVGLSHRMSFTWRFGVPLGVSLKSDTDRFSPSGDRSQVELALKSQFRGKAKGWELIIYDPEGNTCHSASGSKSPPEVYTWDGSDDQGRLVPSGDYKVVVVVMDEFGDPWTQNTTVEIREYDPELKTPVDMEVN